MCNKYDKNRLEWVVFNRQFLPESPQSPACPRMHLPAADADSMPFHEDCQRCSLAHIGWSRSSDRFRKRACRSLGTHTFHCVSFATAQVPTEQEQQPLKLQRVENAFRLVSLLP